MLEKQDAKYNKPFANQFPLSMEGGKEIRALVSRSRLPSEVLFYAIILPFLDPSVNPFPLLQLDALACLANDVKWCVNESLYHCYFLLQWVTVNNAAIIQEQESKGNPVLGGGGHV